MPLVLLPNHIGNIICIKTAGLKPYASPSETLHLPPNSHPPRAHYNKAQLTGFYNYNVVFSALHDDELFSSKGDGNSSSSIPSCGWNTYSTNFCVSSLWWSEELVNEDSTKITGQL
ncbi:hypothetical protein FH972_019193 [Carpinus fangiana]|uniref:Uncharacterized protein n=1 Tax=Carpinus fangiana TaxID=176857 RepID=A0A5N6RTK8_9ROSI|nr:hypothetical protein FH972_019193 [Carpinus fangiana]